PAASPTIRCANRFSCRTEWPIRESRYSPGWRTEMWHQQELSKARTLGFPGHHTRSLTMRRTTRFSFQILWRKRFLFTVEMRAVTRHPSEPFRVLVPFYRKMTSWRWTTFMTKLSCRHARRSWFSPDRLTATWLR